MSQQAQRMPLTLCEVEERAAIREYDGCMTRGQAEVLTARDNLCTTWQELIDHIGGDDGRSWSIHR